MDVKHELQLKYGLGRAPTDAEIADWERATRKLINEGELAEKAGEHAARYNLPGFRTRIFKSEADNIEALLRALASK